MLYNRFTIGFCCMAMHKEPVKTLLDLFVNRISERSDCLLLIYHCFDNLANPISDNSHADSVFNAVSYDAIDVMIVYQTEEEQNGTFKKICRRCHEHNIPVIAIDVPFDNSFFVSFGYGEAFGKIVEHVITQHNCKKIKHMAGIKGNDFSQTRIDSCKEIAQKYGLTLNESDILYGGFWDYPTYQAMDEFFASGEPLPDAFICANDSMAMAVCRKLTENGYKIPDDVIVTGFDGIEIEKYHIPRLATAKRDYNELADTITKIIDDIRYERNIEPYNVELSYTPVFSESCGCVDTSTSKSSSVFTDYIANNDYVLSHEEVMTRMSNAIALNPTFENARKVLLEYSFGGIYLCVSEDYAYCMKTGEIKESSCEEQNEFPEKLMLLLARVDDDQRGFEGEVFSPDIILPDLENRIPGNNTVVITSLYNPQFVIGYFLSYYVHSDIYFNQLYIYNMMVNRCLETVRLHEHMRGLNRKMEFMFTHDQLTKVYNRYGFFKNISEVFSSQENTNTDIFIASVDLNGMKYINDTFGHSEGDEALRITAEALTTAAADTDEKIICSRFGGDEFVVAMICGGDAEEKSECFRENFVSALDKLNDSEGKCYKVSASIGLSCASIADIKNIEELIERADRMMYTDKARHKRRPKD